jgi:hypothetical protein
MLFHWLQSLISQRGLPFICICSISLVCVSASTTASGCIRATAGVSPETTGRWHSARLVEGVRKSKAAPKKRTDEQEHVDQAGHEQRDRMGEKHRRVHSPEQHQGRCGHHTEHADEAPCLAAIAPIPRRINALALVHIHARTRARTHKRTSARARTHRGRGKAEVYGMLQRSFRALQQLSLQWLLTRLLSWLLRRKTAALIESLWVTDSSPAGCYARRNAS